MLKRTMFRVLFFSLLFSFCFIGAAYAKDPFQASGLPIPRFVSTASDMVFVRAGPALRYPIKWVLQKEGLPLEVVQEFDTWRKVRDIKGDEGWVHQSLLKGRRTVIIHTDAPMDLLKRPESGAAVMARLEPNVVASVQECLNTWCKVSAESYSGWVIREGLWGLYDGEVLD